MPASRHQSRRCSRSRPYDHRSYKSTVRRQSQLADRDQPSFLTLPTELRFQIYRFALPARRVQLIDHNSISHSSPPSVPIGADGLRRSCRLLYDEVTTHVLSENTISVRASLSNDFPDIAGNRLLLRTVPSAWQTLAKIAAQFRPFTRSIELDYRDDPFVALDHFWMSVCRDAETICREFPNDRLRLVVRASGYLGWGRQGRRYAVPQRQDDEEVITELVRWLDLQVKLSGRRPPPCLELELNEHIAYVGHGCNPRLLCEAWNRWRLQD